MGYFLTGVTWQYGYDFDCSKIYWRVHIES